jgi:drug/metabolite transporter (DMT)-like permease
VSRRHLIMLVALAAIWGSSFMFIEIALRDLAPSTLILFRMGFGALALGGYIALSGRRFSALRPYVVPLALLGLVNTAVPFFLIAWGQQYIDSGLASIFNASAPLFTALFALGYDRSQRSSGLRLLGILLGFSGVVLLVGFELSGGERAVLGGLAVVGASACYAIGGLYAGRRFNGLPPSLVAFGALVWSTAFVLPFGAAQATTIGWEALLSVLYLGVLATGAAYLLYFGLIAGAGAAKAVLVTYLVPSLALMYGAVFLDEEVTAIAIAGLALVLAGVALGTGALGIRGMRRAEAGAVGPAGSLSSRR